MMTVDFKSLRFITHQSFFSAVRCGDLPTIQRLLGREATAEGKQVDLEGQQPPFPDGSSVSDLMAVQNDAGETPLYVAADNNVKQVFSYLLRFCDVSIVKIRSKSDMDTFHVAAMRGHLGIAPFLQNSPFFFYKDFGG